MKKSVCDCLSPFKEFYKPEKWLLTALISGIELKDELAKIEKDNERDLGHRIARVEKRRVKILPFFKAVERSSFLLRKV